MFDLFKWIRSQIAAAIAAGMEDGVREGVKRITGAHQAIDVDPSESVVVPPPATNGRARKLSATR